MEPSLKTTLTELFGKYNIDIDFSKPKNKEKTTDALHHILDTIYSDNRTDYRKASIALMQVLLPRGETRSKTRDEKDEIIISQVSKTCDDIKKLILDRIVETRTLLREQVPYDDSQ